MAITSVVTKYKPLKIGFLVREGELDDILEVARINSFLVGGTHNLIIPINESNNEEIIKIIVNSDIDILHPIITTPALSEILKNLPYFKTPHNFSDEMWEEDWRADKKNEFIYLDVFHTIKLKNEKYFRGTPKKEKSNVAYISWEDEDILKNWLLLSFGTFKSNYNLKKLFEKGFVNGLRAIDVKILPQGKIPQIISKKITPRVFSTIDLKSYGNIGLNAGIYIGDENNFDDLATFWNLRAIGTRLIFCPILNYERAKDYLQAEITAMTQGDDDTIFNASIYYLSSRNKEEIEPFEKLFTVARPLMLRPISKDTIFSYFDDLPIDYLNWEFSQTIVENENGGIITTVNLPKKKFIFDDSDDIHIQKQSFGVFIDELGKIDSSYFLNPPNIKSLNEFYSREMCFDPWKIRVGKEGVTAIIDTEEKYIKLRPLEQGLIIQKLFEDLGVYNKLSQAGLLSQKIINKLSSIEGARVFKIGGVRELFERLSSTTSLPNSTILDIIKQKNNGVDGFEKHKNLFIESREEKQLKPRMVFDFLLKMGFLRAGLELYCKSCNLKNWLNLKAIDDNWECEYCGNKNLTSIDLTNRGDWRFRKSGLFAKDNNQEGSIPVILTLLYFQRIISGSFLSSPSLKLNFDKKEVEIDFCIVQYKQHQGNKIEVAIGECKSAGGVITQGDCDNLKNVANKLREKGYDVYIIFSKTADRFLLEEIELFKKLNVEKYKLIILTNKEIEPYHPYWEADDKEKLPTKSVISLQDAYKNSFYRYLRDLKE
ncbi:TPA: hypothetical protein DCX66_03630 [Candidatus Nomurabacteria bacterium]|uniref:Uncharacterized protein n=1 Tax=Candidatus Nomurabacteria bacterium GW2011_GWE1_35_16 TaxID=1618761 RepID=A0A0G0BBT4_9BACT|nr:MAG: hypothetical protein UR55_C0001G0022 [Candidatus Nomurabacteria bacterium GW2011_GWF1_34_20]KKP63731.1 MAG: hypothetical protein UR57_C0001G0022 [Candidatus Nomurabacteria bacterium GW2011_GWE2_34_25]KKP66943.1 MAG: hypothetical protein UR64_C0001G0022 [Candidatus Nomurabacteria bacterium GW2011_GWE1_35_16]HAE36767.1 hypothetical protein [Candidatus Nomurabacteria bacterium]HAX65530.1 hypothetical protein [Candidatus Nomurabacteria bacterium]